MRLFALILALGAAVLLAVPARSQGPPPAAKRPAEESAKKVKELQKERITVLKELTQQLTDLYKHGRAPVDELLDARTRLCQAEREAAETDAQRVALDQAFVDALKGFETQAEAMRQAGRGTTAAVLKVKAKRLEVEIQMERAKGAKDGK